MHPEVLPQRWPRDLRTTPSTISQQLKIAIGAHLVSVRLVDASPRFDKSGVDRTVKCHSRPRVMRWPKIESVHPQPIRIMTATHETRLQVDAQRVWFCEFIAGSILRYR